MIQDLVYLPFHKAEQLIAASGSYGMHLQIIHPGENACFRYAQASSQYSKGQACVILQSVAEECPIGSFFIFIYLSVPFLYLLYRRFRRNGTMTSHQPAGSIMTLEMPFLSTPRNRQTRGEKIPHVLPLRSGSRRLSAAGFGKD